MSNSDRTLTVQCGWLREKINLRRTAAALVLMAITGLLVGFFVLVPAIDTVNAWLDVWLAGSTREVVGTVWLVAIYPAISCLWPLFVVHAVIVNDVAERMGYGRLE